MRSNAAPGKEGHVHAEGNGHLYLRAEKEPPTLKAARRLACDRRYRERLRQLGTRFSRAA